MTNDKTVTMSRELVELITKEPCSVDDQVRKMNAIDELRALLAQVVERQPDFLVWLDSAYRGGSDGDHPKFTKYNMEVAYQAGVNNSPPEPIAEFDPCNWSDGQILDFLGVALRNVDLSGEVKLSEIRQGFEYVRQTACLDKVKELNQ